MQIPLGLTATLLAIALTDGRLHLRGWSSAPEPPQRRGIFDQPYGTFQLPPVKRADPIISQTNRTQKFLVDGRRIPNVNFDVGESYSGLLPVSDDQDAAELFFWFFQSENPQAGDEVLVWFNGGPGCSSLEGLLQENGPFSWQYGTFAPVRNQYSWTNLTNVVWVEFPAGVGFSQQNKSPVVQNEEEAAAQFLGFWRNFVDTFGLHKRRIFLAGESYAAYYVSYITDAMYNATEKDPEDIAYFNAEGSLIFDGLLESDVVMTNIPAVPYVNEWSNIFSLNASFTKDINSRVDNCGFTSFLKQALQFPPQGPLPPPPDLDEKSDVCGVWSDILQAALLVNPCFNVYHITTTCPVLWDVLGFPGTFHYIPDGTGLYFDRADVKEAIHAPPSTKWADCTPHILKNDTSLVPTSAVLPRIIKKNKRTILGHGDLDYRIINAGNLIAVQNMTWNGRQGFSVAPEAWKDLYVPYHSEIGTGNLAGAGHLGRWNQERGLTYITYKLAGHMVPQFAPSSAFRTVEYLLGRIDDLSVVSGFTVSILPPSRSSTKQTN